MAEGREGGSGAGGRVGLITSDRWSSLVHERG